MKNTSVVLLVAVAAFHGARAEGEVVSPPSAPVAVDLRTAAVRGVIGAAEVRYSPRWAVDGASVRIEAVDGSVASVLYSGSVGEEGVYDLAPATDSPIRRIRMVTLKNGSEVGEPLAATISFGIRSGAGAATAADTRTNSLQEVAAKGGARLSYDTAWATNAAAVSLEAVRLSGQGGLPVETNVVFSSPADAAGSVPLGKLDAGWWRLYCRIFDSSGLSLLEYCTHEFRSKGGMYLIVR